MGEPELANISGPCSIRLHQWPCRESTTRRPPAEDIMPLGGLAVCAGHRGAVALLAIPEMRHRRELLDGFSRLPACRSGLARLIQRPSRDRCAAARGARDRSRRAGAALV